MAECKHFVDPPEACLDCNPRPVLMVPPDWGPWFTASYPGQCAGCADGILPGDKIRADGQDGYLCSNCGGIGDAPGYCGEGELADVDPQTGRSSQDDWK